MTLEQLWKGLRIGWRFAPWIVLAVVALRWWASPPAGSSSAPGQTVIVAGKAALTPPAADWREPPPSDCTPAAGDPGVRFKVQTREPSAEELERLARQYGFTFGDRELSADLAGMPIPPYGGKPAASNPVEKQAVARMLGEYSAPTLRYGGTFASALLKNGELETRFDPSPAPRLGFPLVWGGGAFYDLTQPSAEATSARPNWRLYGFFEPIQTKQVYWRLEAGLQELAVDLERDLYVGVSAEWRSEPWIRKNKRGLRAVKVSD